MAKQAGKTGAEDLKGKTPDELKALLLEMGKKALNMRFQKVNGQLQNTSEVRKVRRTIARIKTFMNEKAKAGQTTRK